MALPSLSLPLRCLHRFACRLWLHVGPRSAVVALCVVFSGMERALGADLTTRLTVALATVSAEKASPDAAVLTDLLTAGLSADPRWKLIERTALRTLEQELALSAGGWADSGTAVRQGRLAHADVVLVCRLRDSGDASGEAAIEAVDAFRAEQLGQVRVPLSARPNGPWLRSPPAADTAAISAATEKLLAAALARLDQTRGRPVIAPLFMHNTGVSQRVNPLGAQLIEALEAAAGKGGARMLRVQAADAVQSEGLLCNMGMTEFSAESWAQVADVFFWAEFFEGESAGKPVGEVPVQLRLWAWSGAGEPQPVELKGTLGQLDALASEGAQVVMAKLARREKPLPEARRQVAKLLLTEAASIGLPDLRIGVSIGRADEVRRIGVMRLVDAAAFFVPEDPVVQELRLELLRRAVSDVNAESGLRQQAVKLAREFMRRSDGSIDIGLVERLLRQPYGQEHFELIGDLGKALRDVPATELQTGRELFEGILGGLWMERGNAGVLPALEAIWPAMLAAMPDAFDPKVARPFLRERLSIREIYSNDSARGEALLAGRLKGSSLTGALPAVHLYKSVRPSLAQWAPALAPAPQLIPLNKPDTVSPLRTSLDSLRNRPHRPLKSEGNRFLLDGLPELHPATAAFSPLQVSVEPPAEPLGERVVAAVAGAQALWVITKDFQVSGASFPDGNTPNFWRFDPVLQTAVCLTDRLGTRAELTSLAFGAGQVWIGTRGEGLRVYDPTREQARAITSAAGLPFDDINRLLVAGQDVYIEGGRAEVPVVFRWREPSGKTLRMALPSGKDSPASPLLSAAFGPEGAVVPPVLAELPASSWGEILDGIREWKRNSQQAPGPAPAACAMSAGTGYWLGSGALLTRVSEGRARIEAAWACSSIDLLADDGRFLYVQTRGSFDELRGRFDWSDAGVPMQRVFVFDHQEGRWIGWFGAPEATGMTAAPGALWLWRKRLFPVLAIDTSAWSLPVAAQGTSPAGDLLALIGQHKTEAVRLALKGGASVNQTTPSGWTPLHAAVWAGDAELVRLLLDAGARTDATDRRGWHPLQMAAAQGDLSLVELLLQKGAAVNFAGMERPWAPSSRNHFGAMVRRIDRRTALHAAAAEGHAAAVTALLKAGADWRLLDGGGQTAMHLAVESIAGDTVKALMAGGADPGTKNAGGVSAAAVGGTITQLQAIFAAVPVTVDDLSEKLRSACGIGGRLDEVRQLVEAGADPSAGGDKAIPALVKAMDFGHWEYVPALLACPGDLSQMTYSFRAGPGPVGALALYLSLSNNRPDTARSLLAAGARPVNTCFPPLSTMGGDHHTILHMAAVSGDAEVFGQLIELGARSGPNERPLHTAVASKNAAMLRLLVPLYPGRGKLTRDTIDCIAGDGRTALVQAVIDGWRDGVEILVTAGASTEVTDHDGRNLQQLAGGDAEINLLLNRRPGAPDNQRSGAEAVAAIECNDPRLETWPIDAGVLRYRDSRNWTVLHHACAKERDSFVLRLIAAGAPVNVLTAGGMTPLAFISNRSESLIAALLQAGADVNLAGDRALTPLHRAAGSNNLGTVKLLLAAGADWRRLAFWYGEPPLLTAAKQSGSMAVVQALLDAGASLQACDSSGQGVFEYAVRSNDPAVIQFFLDRGAGWRTAEAGNEYHPLLIAVQKGATESLRKVLALGLYDERALALATDPAIRGMLEDAAHDKGLRIVDDEELWPLICADEANWQSRAEAHVSRGGNVNYRSASWTPLMLALQQVNPALVRWLLARKADPRLLPLENHDDITMYGQSLYEDINQGMQRFGAQRDEALADMCKALLAAGVAPTAHYELEYAALGGCAKTVRVLLDGGVAPGPAVNDIEKSSSDTPERRAAALKLLRK